MVYFPRPILPNTLKHCLYRSVHLFWTGQAQQSTLIHLNTRRVDRDSKHATYLAFHLLATLHCVVRPHTLFFLWPAFQQTPQCCLICIKWGGARLHMQLTPLANATCRWCRELIPLQSPKTLLTNHAKTRQPNEAWGCSLWGNKPVAWKSKFGNQISKHFYISIGSRE
jgi:hypothetical protein